MNPRYIQTQGLLERALRHIPLGTQTFSKSHLGFPDGQAPLFVSHGQGGQVWDIDGNRYVDLVNGLLSVVLGYADPDVNAAVADQLGRGVTFSLATDLEIRLAERMAELVPCAEMVRFGKNGSDATAGAIRVARAHTGRDRVAICGYHGWQDWYIGATSRNKGVPQAVRDLTHGFAYNSLDSLDSVLSSHPGEFAAVIMEPMNLVEPLPGFLEGVKQRAHAHGALFILDETITGFRFHLGGAQRLFGVTPDLATFGKGVANGFPISILAGRREFMKEMEEIFFSFTFGGEAISLAAALATVEKMQREPVIETLQITGSALRAGTRERIAHHGLDEAMEILGHPSWSIFRFKDGGRYDSWQLKTLFLQEVLARGVLTLGSHNISYAHTAENIQQVLDVYDAVFPILREVIEQGTLERHLRCPAMAPIFAVR